MAEPRGVGRPNKFQDLNLDKVKVLAEQGWTDRQMALFFDVCEATWHNWKKDHPEFLESIGDWKRNADTRVERTLYERACGYDFIETKFFTHLGAITDTIEVIKHVPPDVGAQKMWLTNRKSADWKDKQEQDLNIAGGLTLKWEGEIGVRFPACLE